jgi:hypothetical protein
VGLTATAGCAKIALMPSLLRCLFYLSVFTFGAACDDGSGRSSHPDTGYGKDQPVPSQENCVDFCARISDCGGHLCAEDTGNTQYIAMFEAVNAECLATCTDATVMSRISADHWQCLFQSSCRQLLEADVCDAQAEYHCT